MVIVITGIMAAGKSTVAQILAERLPRSAHVRGDIFRRMIVSGRAQRTPAGSAEEEAQLTLRYRLSAQAADSYAAAGFTAVVQDVIQGDHLTAYARMIRTRPCHIVVLAPRPEVVAAREAGRPRLGTATGLWRPCTRHSRRPHGLGSGWIPRTRQQLKRSTTSWTLSSKTVNQDRNAER